MEWKTFFLVQKTSWCEEAVGSLLVEELVAHEDEDRILRMWISVVGSTWIVIIATFSFMQEI